MNLIQKRVKMFDTRFNNGYQNTVMPLNTDTYLNQMPQNSYGQNPYAQGNVLSNMMGNNAPYPTPPSQSFPAANMQNPNTVSYADGGTVKKKKNKAENSPYPMLAEMIRKQGKGEDTVLAHINPLEAMILKDLGGSGTINPKTGLPQFEGAFDWLPRIITHPIKTITKAFKKPAHTAKRFIGNTVAPVAGTVLGNMIAPGIGGIIGGGLGGGAGSSALGKGFGSGALSGALTGALLPTVSGLVGTGANALGATSAGHALTKYGNINAILPSLGLDNMFGSGTGGGLVAGSAVGNSGAVGGGASAPQSGVSAGDGDESFTDKLLGNTKDFLTKPKNLLTLGVVGSQFMNRPKEKKEKTPEQQADEAKRLERALRLSPADRAGMEANLLAEEQMRRRIARQKFLPEERLGHIEPMYRKSNTPEEHKKHGKWLSYYNNPEFSGEPIPYKKGGNVDIMERLKNDPTLIIELEKRLEGALKQPTRPEIIARGQKLTTDIIEKNKNQHKGLLDEKSLNRDLANLTKTLGLTEGEVYALERYTENIFKDNQFTDGPGYFYSKAHGNPITMKMGGSPNHREYFEEEMQYPSGLGRYIAGDTNGQDDKIQALLSDGEYVIPADVVAHLGDGNNTAGAKKLDMGLKKIRKHKGGIINKLPPKAKSLASYLK